MILTVTPNAAIDKTYLVERFGLDRVHRPSGVRAVAGGKGINVARIYRTLGGKVMATGFLGGGNGQFIARGLEAEGIEDAFVRIESDSRMCLAIVDPIQGTQTEINELGPKVSAQEVRSLLHLIERLLVAHPFDFIVMNGSLPQGVPPTLYADLIEIAQRTKTRAVLDAGGEALREGVKARPWLVKPNRSELESLSGKPLSDQATLLEAAQLLRSGGISVVAVTLGAEGALLLTDQGTYEAKPFPVVTINPVASGDSFLAALLWAWNYGAKPGDGAEALRLATAAGAANAARFEAACCTREDIYTLANLVQIREKGKGEREK